MSVIGRLDAQVDALLITPRQRNDAAETATTETSTRAATTDEPTRRHEAHEEAAARRTAPTELPVWLL